MVTITDLHDLHKILPGQSVNLHFAHLNEHQVRHLVEEILPTRPKINALSIRNSALNCEDAKLVATAMKTNKYLKSLHLDNNQIGNAGAKHLASLLKTHPSLYLGVTYNQIGPDGASSLAQAWANTNRARSISFEGNNLGDEGAACIARALAARQGAISNLDLTHNQITATGDQFLAATLPKNINVTYRINKIPYSVYYEKHPIIALFVILFCLPVFLFLVLFNISREEKSPGLLHSQPALNE